MGKIINARFSQLYPGEDWLSERVLAETIMRARKETLFIIPAKRYRDNKYINLDGRHRLIYHKLTGAKGIELFLAENPDDIITEQIFQHRHKSLYDHNNECIPKRWDCVSIDEINRNNICTHTYTNYDEYFAKLQELVPYLKDFDSCLIYMKVQGYIPKKF